MYAVGGLLAMHIIFLVTQLLIAGFWQYRCYSKQHQKPINSQAFWRQYRQRFQEQLYLRQDLHDSHRTVIWKFAFLWCWIQYSIASHSRTLPVLPAAWLKYRSLLEGRFAACIPWSQGPGHPLSLRLLPVHQLPCHDHCTMAMVQMGTRRMDGYVQVFEHRRPGRLGRLRRAQVALIRASFSANVPRWFESARPERWAWAPGRAMFCWDHDIL